MALEQTVDSFPDASRIDPVLQCGVLELEHKRQRIIFGVVTPLTGAPQNPFPLPTEFLAFKIATNVRA